MNVIVRKHYPVEKLPEDLREGIPGGASVTVTITGEDSEARGEPMTTAEVVALLRRTQQANRGKGVTPEAAAREVRALRDEWDD
jgi:hypothetical protein